MLWTAPELLRLSNGQRPVRDNGTQKGDVFSFAIILHEMLFNKGAMYTEEEMDAEGKPQTIFKAKSNSITEIIQKLCQTPDCPDSVFRPPCSIKMHNKIDDHEFVESMVKLMQTCWSENPDERPNFILIRKTVHGLNK